MITRLIREDIFTTPLLDIAFAINCEGLNDSGFAGLVARRFWPGLERTGKRELGETLHLISVVPNSHRFHAIVCHSLLPGGWENSDLAILHGLDSIDAEEIACVLMGDGSIGKMQKADVFKILDGIAQCNKKVWVYSREGF